MLKNITIILMVVLLLIPTVTATVTSITLTQSTDNYLEYNCTSDATVDYSWEFDDGGTYSTKNCTHTFTEIGDHWVNMTSETTSINQSFVVSYKLNRVKSSDPIEYDGSDSYETIENNGTFSLESIVTGITISYTTLLGNFFYFVCFGVPILMIWIRTGDVVIPAILGMLIGAFAMEYLPPEYEYADMIFMVLAIAGMLTQIFKSKG